MKKIISICLFLFLMTLICCKMDVGLDKDNSICLTISESKKKNVFKNSYKFQSPQKLTDVEILEAWSENIWFYENGILVIDENNFNFNVSFKFKKPKDNFLNNKLSYVHNKYFTNGAYVANVYKSTFKKDSMLKYDKIELLLVIQNHTIPIEFVKE